MQMGQHLVGGDKEHIDPLATDSMREPCARSFFRVPVGPKDGDVARAALISPVHESLPGCCWATPLHNQVRPPRLHKAVAYLSSIISGGSCTALNFARITPHGCAPAIQRLQFVRQLCARAKSVPHRGVLCDEAECLFFPLP